MKVQEIRKMSNQDLHKKLAELRDSVREFRFKIGSKEVKNNRQMHLLKKDVARILTILGEKKNA